MEFRLPDLGEGTTEGELVRWLVKAGDRVALDQPIAEVQTDKVLVELPAPAAGTIQALHVAEGQVVPVGTNLLTIEESASPVAAPASPTAVPAPPTTVPAPPEPAGSARSEPSVQGQVAAPAPERPAPGAPRTNGATPPVGVRADSSAADGWTPVPASAGRRVLATPSVRRLAREHGIDLATVPATGLAGRVLATDLWARIQEAGRASEMPAEMDVVQAETHAAVATLSMPLAPAPVLADTGPDEERLPLRGLRRRIAENMVLAASTIPHVTSMVEIDASGLVALRRAVLPAAEARGVKLSYLPFIVKALVQVLRAHPYVNAAIDDTSKEIVLKRRYHIGIATATPDGLLVPVLHDADRLTVLEAGAAIERLAELGRARKLGLDELRGSTFTISNYGAVGGFFATPIINPGEAGILGLGRIVERPWVVAHQVEVRPVLPLSFSADHRLIDGDLAMRFMNTLIALLEQPERLILELR